MTANWRDWLFSVKAFSAAMLALFLGLFMDLPRPYWAMGTVYIVASPLSGATRSKALYRVMGTVLGAIAALVMVPTLQSAPILLSLAMAAWVGLCLSVSLLDRTPRSYVFMLAGYSAAIIGMPSVVDPAGIFDVAVARVEEITLGIVCASLVMALAAPTSVTTVLGERIDAWLADASAWAGDILALGRADEQRRDRARLVADVQSLDVTAYHLGFDLPGGREARRQVQALRGRMLTLVPLLSSLADRLGAVRALSPEPRPEMAATASALSAWVKSSDAPDRFEAEAQALRSQVAALEPRLAGAPGWAGMLGASLISRMTELLDIWQDCRTLRDRIAAGRIERGWEAALRRPALAAHAQHLDRGMVLRSGLAAAGAVLLCCLASIHLGWIEGVIAVEMVAVTTSFWAASDNPTPQILSFATWTLGALLVVAVYTYAVLPMVTGFGILVLVLAPTFLLFGRLVARPATYAIGMPLAVNTATLLSIQTTFGSDFAAFLNAGIATIAGMLGAAVLTSIVRSIGADAGASRLLKAAWLDLAAIAARAGRISPQRRAGFVGLMLDRLGLLMPRLAATPDRGESVAGTVLRDLRAGMNVLDLQEARAAAPPAVRDDLDAVLDGIGRHFAGQARTGTAERPPATLLAALDRALLATSPADLGIVNALVGLRRGLFHDAAPPEMPVAAEPLMQRQAS